MNKGVTLIGGLGVGAALMYMFDPDRGRRRRAMVKDKFVAAGNKAGDLAGKMSRDVRNRMYGSVEEIKSIFRHEDVSDEVLVQRVRSKLGRYPVHEGALNVTAHNGTVTLRGQILECELPKVLRATKYVRGVKSVDNRMDVHAEAGDISALQGHAQPASV